MSASLQFALSNPMPGKDPEYNAWYEHHLVSGVLTSGVLAGQRFRRIAAPWPAGKHEYMVIWEFDDPAYALEQLAQVKGTESMPIGDAIDMVGLQPPTMWLRAGVRNSARIATDNNGRKTCVLVLANAKEGEETAFERHLLTGGLTALADESGVMSADFLTLADQQIRGNARKYRYALLLELSDETQALKTLAGSLSDIPHLDRERWMAPVYRPISGRLTTAAARHHA